jgi:predicted glycosyltransferase
VLGPPEIFDPRREYDLPNGVVEKLSFCGYLRRKLSGKPRRLARKESR